MSIGILIGGAITFAFQAKAERVTYTAPIEEPKVILIATTTELTIEQKIRATFPEDPETALKIAKCESNLNPKAISPTNDHGLMQINLTVHDVEGDIYNVDTNLKFARKLYDERGWKPWTCLKLIK